MKTIQPTYIFYFWKFQSCITCSSIFVCLLVCWCHGILTNKYTNMNENNTYIFVIIICLKLTEKLY